MNIEIKNNVKRIIWIPFVSLFTLIFVLMFSHLLMFNFVNSKVVDSKNLTSHFREKPAQSKKVVKVEKKKSVINIESLSPRKYFDYMRSEYNRTNKVSLNTKQFAKVLLNSESLRVVNDNNLLTSKDIPTNLVLIDPSHYLKSESAHKFLKLNEQYKNFFHSDLEVITAYRSYKDQKKTFQHWVSVYGPSVATQVSSKPGASEHQLGLSLDIQEHNDKKLNKNFDNTVAFDWLSRNVYKFGFVLRYPKDKVNVTTYNYEPWHYRYVGEQNAMLMRKLGSSYTIEELRTYLKSLR